MANDVTLRNFKKIKKTMLRGFSFGEGGGGGLNIFVLFSVPNVFPKILPFNRAIARVNKHIGTVTPTIEGDAS
jgi:hypothetical protein